ncbi:hypothetical protein RB2654_14325 [Rhodobacterales bacterium HTCC2654]|uniref:Uncharacterized protein n=1 Tax=Maritimibacter alkaliphilus HTCC2654 TaxID=314271 RepID=A3VGR4_9RHOB|nr:hypothetical protein RB2654_14325 [Rhodobacterales bacterium HTCC2654] [Maritimibacter alkaliphilus HTCC2654]
MPFDPLSGELLGHHMRSGANGPWVFWQICAVSKASMSASS